jgi:hypothetical protein
MRDVKKCPTCGKPFAMVDQSLYVGLVAFCAAECIAAWHVAHDRRKNTVPVAFDRRHHV